MEPIQPALPTFEALGHVVGKGTGKIETFPAPHKILTVSCKTDEFTSLCPITGAPDFSTIEITYIPNDLCLESKSLKLYLQTYREEGVFCEALAEKIAKDIYDACAPQQVIVTVEQKLRGGIGITAVAVYPEVMPVE